MGRNVKGSARKVVRRVVAKAQGELELALPPTERPTLAQMCDNYERRHLLRKAKATQQAERFFLRAYVKELPPYPTALDVADFVTRKLQADPGWAESTLYVGLTVGSRVCRMARNEWPTVVCPDPFGEVTKPTRRRLQPKALPDDVWPRILAEACKDDRERAFCCLGYHEGLRVSEVLGLEPQHLHLKADPPTVSVLRQRSASTKYSHDPKTESSKAELPLHWETVKYLKRARFLVVPEDTRTKRGRPRSSELYRRFLFPYWARDLYDAKTKTGLFDRMRAVAPEAFPRKVKGRGGTMFHALRHAFGEALDKAGVPARKAKFALRHASERNTETYFSSFRGARGLDPEVKRAAEAVQDAGRPEAAKAAGKSSVGTTRKGVLRAL